MKTPEEMYDGMGCWPVFFVFLAIGLFFSGCWGGFSMAESRLEMRAVSAGKAEYLTTESGQQVWRWKP